MKYSKELILDLLSVIKKLINIEITESVLQTECKEFILTSLNDLDGNLSKELFLEALEQDLLCISIINKENSEIILWDENTKTRLTLLQKYVNHLKVTLSIPAKYNWSIIKIPLNDFIKLMYE